ncbi:hypothetical protein VCV18_009820 [Metarhizium anisopliae]
MPTLRRLRALYAKSTRDLETQNSKPCLRGTPDDEMVMQCIADRERSYSGQQKVMTRQRNNSLRAWGSRLVDIV